MLLTLLKQYELQNYFKNYSNRFTIWILNYRCFCASCAKIGQNSFTINPKAVLELESTSKGFLPPRMSASNQSAGYQSSGWFSSIHNGWLRIRFANLEGNKWIAFVDTEALSLKRCGLTAETSRAQGAESTNILQLP
jgi:hypothetical protein